VSRKTPQTGRLQQEHVHYFVNALSCSSASQLVTIVGFTQAIFLQRAPHARSASLPRYSELLPVFST